MEPCLSLEFLLLLWGGRESWLHETFWIRRKSRQKVDHHHHHPDKCVSQVFVRCNNETKNYLMCRWIFRKSPHFGRRWSRQQRTSVASSSCPSATIPPTALSPSPSSRPGVWKPKTSMGSQVRGKTTTHIALDDVCLCVRFLVVIRKRLIGPVPCGSFFLPLLFHPLSLGESRRYKVG